MLFMVIEQFRNQDGKSVYRRLRQKGRLMPDGLEFVNSWVAADLGRCFQLMECGDVTLLQQWVAEWSDLTASKSFRSCPARRRPPRWRIDSSWGSAAMKKTLLSLLVFLAALSSARAQEEDVAAFFKGKTLRLIVGIGVGSGYDINARLLARHLAAHIPGQPTIIVQNQPGAGSLTMTNALYNTGPFDGTVMGASFNGMPTTPLLQPAGVRFDPV